MTENETKALDTLKFISQFRPCSSIGCGGCEHDYVTATDEAREVACDIIISDGEQRLRSVTQQAFKSTADIIRTVGAERGVFPNRYSPISGGGVHIRFRYGSREINIDTYPDGHYEYLIVEYAEKGRVFVERHKVLREEILSLFDIMS